MANLKMQLYAFVLVTIAAATAIPLEGPDAIDNEVGSRSARIVDGFPATAGQFPWQVVVVGAWADEQMCTGALISDKLVLTAAHCVEGGTSVVMYLGIIDRTTGADAGRLEVDSHRIAIHPKYNSITYTYDVALIFSALSISFNERISAIRLPLQKETLKANTMVTVSGWGQSDDNTQLSNLLHFAKLKTISNKICKDSYQANEIGLTSVCAVGDPQQGPCAGDSGAPLIVYDFYRVATLAGVFTKYHKSGCDKGRPSVYVRVEKLLPWIKEALDQH